MNKFLLMTVLILLLAIATAGGVSSMTQNEINMPLIFKGASSDPTLEPTSTLTPTITSTPTVTLTPTPTATIVPGELWVYIMTSRNEGDVSVTYAVVPGKDFELKGEKIDKTLYITAYCPEGLECEVEPVPPDFPPECNFPTGPWCEIEKLEYPANAKQTCGAQFPYNCVDTIN
jgi:hypothetical protein